jgi:Ca2+/H+ antiporter, TMEM165/GDT1 family
MKLRTRHSPLLLLFLPSLATTLTVQPPKDGDTVARAISGAVPETSPPIKTRFDIGTRAAPVDGKDGRPHEGPFVDTDRKKDADGEKKDLPPLKGRPEDPTIVDGKKIPEINDGVMDDRDRQRPKAGTTGTEGGVSEKDKARKAQESKTGERVENKPATPKEAPPLPHSEEEKILNDKESKKDTGKDVMKDKMKTDAKTPEDVAGLEVREFLNS